MDELNNVTVEAPVAEVVSEAVTDISTNVVTKVDLAAVGKEILKDGAILAGGIVLYEKVAKPIGKKLWRWGKAAINGIKEQRKKEIEYKKEHDPNKKQEVQAEAKPEEKKEN